MEPTDREITEAMRALLDRLSDIGWIKSSWVSEKDFHVAFTPMGRAALQLLGELLHQTRFPAAQADWVCLANLCQRSAEIGDAPNPP